MCRNRLLAALTLSLVAAAAQPAPTGEMVAIGGHRVHLQCQGEGLVTVVLIHGTPRFSFHFALVQPKIAEFARVCSYDRAGDAWSDSIAGQPTARIFVEELARVTRYVSPRAPVILAGHSVGGVLARAFYARYPERVSAMVMIDTAPLDSARITLKGVTKPMTQATEAELKAYAAEITAKGPPPFPKPSLGPPFNKLPARLHDAHLWATGKWYDYAARVDMFQSLKYQADLYRLAGSAHANAASSKLPVWFLTRAAKPEGAEPWVEQQQRMASAWAKAKLVRVAPSSHDIQLDQPDAVVAAIREAVQASAR